MHSLCDCDGGSRDRMVREGLVAHNVYSPDHREDFLWSPSALEGFTESIRKTDCGAWITEGEGGKRGWLLDQWYRTHGPGARVGVVRLSCILREGAF